MKRTENTCHSRWFAWRPVRTNMGWRWLTWVVRSMAWNGIYGSQNSYFWWEYEALPNHKDTPHG